MKDIGQAHFPQRILRRRSVDQRHLGVGHRWPNLGKHITRQVDDRKPLTGGGHGLKLGNRIIGVGSFADRPVVLALIATAGLVMMVMLFPLAGEWGKRPSRFDAETAGRVEAEEQAEGVAEA